MCAEREWRLLDEVLKWTTDGFWKSSEKSIEGLIVLMCGREWNHKAACLDTRIKKDKGSKYISGNKSKERHDVERKKEREGAREGGREGDGTVSLCFAWIAVNPSDRTRGRIYLQKLKPCLDIHSHTSACWSHIHGVLCVCIWKWESVNVLFSDGWVWEYERSSEPI